MKTKAHYYVLIAFLALGLGAATAPASASSNALIQNQASAVATADNAYYQAVAYTAKNEPVAVAAYATSARENSDSRIRAVITQRRGVARFIFKTGPVVCISTTTTHGPAPKIVPCK